MLSYCLNAQIDVWQLNNENYELFKKTTTYFIVPDYDIENKQQYIDVLSKIWSITKLKVITSQEASKINMNDISVSLFKPIVEKLYYEETNTAVHMYYKYELYMNEKKDIKKEVFTTIAHINFCVTPQTKQKFLMLHNSKSSAEEKDKFVFSPDFAYNLSLGFLKNAVQSVHSHLINNVAIEDKNKKIDLIETKKFGKLDTLFIPDYITLYPLTQIDEAFSKAKFNYKIISTSELNNKILYSNKDFYYLNFVVNNIEKTINVVKAKDGFFIFNNWNPIGLNPKNLTLRPEDVKLIGNSFNLK